MCTIGFFSFRDERNTNVSSHKGHSNHHIDCYLDLCSEGHRWTARSGIVCALIIWHYNVVALKIVRHTPQGPVHRPLQHHFLPRSSILRPFYPWYTSSVPQREGVPLE